MLLLLTSRCRPGADMNTHKKTDKRDSWLDDIGSAYREYEQEREFIKKLGSLLQGHLQRTLDYVSEVTMQLKYSPLCNPTWSLNSHT